jgi:hypothetical protein
MAEAMPFQRVAVLFQSKDCVLPRRRMAELRGTGLNCSAYERASRLLSYNGKVRSLLPCVISNSGPLLSLELLFSPLLKHTTPVSRPDH